MRIIGLAISMLVAAVAFAFPAVAAANDPTQFGLSSFTTSVVDEGGVEVSQAGGHPFAATAHLKFNTRPPIGDEQTGMAAIPVEHLKDTVTDLPPGFVGDPTATSARCQAEELERADCPIASQVGLANVLIMGGTGNVGIWNGVYNMVPPPGHPAMLGIKVSNVGVVPLFPRVRSESDYGLTVTTRNNIAAYVTEITVTLWGVPADPGHNADRHLCYFGGFFCNGPNPPADPPKPFLTLPASGCTDKQPVTTMRVDSWENPGIFKSYDALSPVITGCDALTFEPTAEVSPTTSKPGAPTGLDVGLNFPTEDNAAGLAPPALKKAVVTMPEGMSINPTGANGLAACDDDGLKLKSIEPVNCPDASKIGTVRAKSPVLEEELTGGMFIRSQNSNDPESGEMFRIALVLENEERGLSFRLPGQVRVNKDSGRIEAIFDNNPELPVSDIDVRLKDGPRSPLVTPSSCGEKTISVQLTSWGGQTVNRTSTFDIDCVAGRDGFSPSFAAGTTTPLAAQSSAFTMTIAREEGSRELKAIKSVRLPEGLLGKVASVPLCSEVQASAGACPDASRIGHVQIAAGAGASPLWVPQAGKDPTGVYLTGPYGGAPYGLSIKVPAQAGPFDLGVVVARSALHVDERTAAITSGVDESRLIDRDGTVTEVLPEALPRILKGVVLNQREIRLIMDREDFIVNPTDCSQKQITAEIYSYGDDRADVGNRFRAVECANLGFVPRFRARILDKGRKSTLRSWHPRTRFTVVPRKGDANIGGARVALPSSTILDQGNIGTTCTRAQMTARACPAASVVGYAKAWSPLLRKAVEGPVYLAANGGVRPLPDLAAVLDGEIRVVLQGEISTLRSGGKARLQNTFRVVPDAPVERFVLTMRGGKNRGLLVNSTDLCRTNERGVAVFNGQNNRRSRQALRLTPSFKGCTKVRRQAAKRALVRKKAARRAARA